MSELFKSNWRFGGARWLLAALLLLLTTGAWAGQSPAPASHHRTTITTNNPAPWLPQGPLTLEQALQRALECNGQIRSLQAAVEVAHEQRRAATDIPDPEVKAEARSISAGVARSAHASSDELDNPRIYLSVFVPNPWLTVPRVDARTADYEAAQADLNAARWLVGCEVRQLFAELDYLTNDLAFSADRARLNGEILSAVQARVGQGAATASELMTASRQNVQFQDDLDQAFHRYQLARRKLAALLDIAPGSFDLATNLVPPPALPESGLTFPQAETMAARSRWDLAALRWRAQAATSTYHEIRNARVPWIKEVDAGYWDISLDNSEKYWIGFGMDIPIFSWTKNHAAAAALAQARLASVNETNSFKLLRQELHDALDEWDQTWQQLNRHETSVNPLITTMRQTLATLQSTPNIMPEQVAAAELQLVETLRLELNTRWQYELALFNLERTLGAPLN